MMKASAALSHCIVWFRAILQTWDALTELLKTEKNMPQSDIDNIKQLGSYLELPFDAK